MTSRPKPAAVITLGNGVELYLDVKGALYLGCKREHLCVDIPLSFGTPVTKDRIADIQSCLERLKVHARD